MDTDTINNINFYWKQIFHAFKKSSKPVLAKLGLTKVDANILLSLSDGSEETKAELAQHLSFKPNSLTRSLDRLIELDLVKRAVDIEDQRFIRLSLTNKGKKLARVYIFNMRNLWIEMLNGIGQKEVKAFETTLQKIHCNL